MKTLRFLILGLLVTATFCQAQITSPGWFQVQAPTASVQAASFQSIQSDLAFPPGPNQPTAPMAEAITPQIQALADGLQDNPTNIFDYVHDHIKFVLYFGAKKGAQLTLLEKSGNDFDQCALLVALLSAAGYSNNVGYVFGWQEIPYDDPYDNNYDLHHWWQLTLNNTNWTTTANYVTALAVYRGYPLDASGYVMVYPDTVNAIDGSYTNNFLMQRIWVALGVGTNIYQLDPAFKISQPGPVLAGFSLTNALGSGTISNDLLSAASGTDTTNYAQNLSESAVRGRLTAYTTNLLNCLYSNAPNASVPQLWGGWQIVPANNLIDFTSLLHFPSGTVDGMSFLIWNYEPTNMMSTLSIAFAGTSYQWFIPQLQGQRLSLTFSNNGMAQLWQEDTPLAQGTTSGSGTTNVVLAVTHPFGSWDPVNNVLIPNLANGANATVTNAYQSTNATYAILYAFEPDWGWLQQRQDKLDAYLQEGYTNGSRQVTSETLNVMGLNWMLQTDQVGRLLAQRLGMLPQYFHRIGRMAQEGGNGYYVDAYMEAGGTYPSGGSDAAHLQGLSSQFDLLSFFGSALEHGLIEQLQNTNIVGASAIKMLEIANTNRQAVYLASSNNWTAGYNVQSHLTAGTYDAGTLAAIATNISEGDYVLLPANGANHVTSESGSWAGYGYEAMQFNGGSGAVAMVISGGYDGGFSSEPDIPVDPTFVDSTEDNQPTSFLMVPISTPTPTIADPVDAADGTFQVEQTDLSLGQAEPRGLTLSRYYNGTRRFSNPAGMAGGWLHNYYVNANNLAAPQAGLGGTTPAQAAPMLAALTAALATYNGGQPDARNWLTLALIAKWGVDQLTKNGVSVNLGQETVQFVQQPNGVFTPPANCTMTLTQSNGLYSLQQRHGNRFNFDALGRLSTLVDPYSQSLSIAYLNSTSTLPSTVTDWKSRALTFKYGNGQLTNVADSTGRSVAYGYSTAYNPQGDLISFTDAENKTSTYGYDTNHEITATIDAQSRLVVSNAYDTQGHVTTQWTQGLTNKTWHVYWSGWQTTELDPAGGEQSYGYDDQTRLISQVDALGHTNLTFYDGQNHVIQTISPLNETNELFYDGNNNLIESADPLGNTSQYLHDTNNNLIETIDPLGHASTFGYNAQFSLTGQTNGAGDWVNYVYNSNGTLASRADSGGTTSYGYDSTYGQLISITYPNSLGSESFANSALGDLTNHTDPRGFATSYQYNARRQLTNSVGPTNVLNQIAYDAIGNVVSATDARTNSTSNTWSATRHLLTMTFPATPQGTPVITNGYDVREWLTSTADPLLNPTSYTNDPDQHLIAAADPLKRTTQFYYDADGHQLAAVNAQNETNRQTFDARGLVVSQTDGAGHSILSSNDAAGNQIILTNRNSKKWQFQFDAANRLTFTISPLGRSNSVAFNHQGLVSLATDQLGQPTYFYYDAKGRLTNRTDNLATTAYGHDANNHLTGVTEGSRSNVWTYDAYNRVTTYQDINGYTILYHYDANGNLTNLVYPGGKNVYYAYDRLNRLTNVTDWSSRKTTLGYDLDSHLTSITRPNGSFRTINYDAAGQVTNIWEQMANSLPIGWFRLNWTNSGSMAWEFAAPLPHTNAPPLRTMTYDADNRLATFKGPTMGSAQNVTLDLNGNLTSGPVTSDIFTNYTYDARNRLLNAGGVTNTYDALNSRIGQTAGTNSTTYVVNPNASLPQVLMRIKNGVTNYYIYGAGLLYQITESAAGESTLTYHYDYRGSTIALSADSGLVTDRMEYSLYGSTTYRAGTNDTPFLYNGRYGVQTDTNGLLYMGARYYNPYLCRFLNPDPSGFKGGLNFYAYANGNPVSYLDPFGLGAVGDDDSGGVRFSGSIGSFSGTYSGDVYSSGDGSTFSAEDIAATVVLTAVSVVSDTEVLLPEELEAAGIEAATTGSGGAAADSGGAFANYMQQAQTLDVSTAQNGAVFWSGQGNQALAEQFAAANEKTTLEMTSGGSWMQSQDLFNPATSPLTPNQAIQVWQTISQRFAAGASGNAIGFVNGARAASTFNTIEYPTLINNPNILNVITGGH